MSDISLGDLMSAFCTLEADEETRFAITKLLKLTPFLDLEQLKEGGTRRAARRGGGAVGDNARGAAGARTGAPERELEEDQLFLKQPKEPLGPLPPKKDGKEIPSDQAVTSVIPSRLAKVGDGVVQAPPWGAEVPMLKAEVPAGGPPQPFEPLLVRTWTRAILSGVLSRRSDDGPLNVRMVVERVARGEVSLRLPRYPRPTLARGVQVLIDRNEAMLPFFQDQNWLEREVLKVVGPSCRQTLYFEGCPTRKAGHGSKSGWQDYLTHHLPRSGTVLLLLTDLGIGQPVSPHAPASEREWLEFAKRLRKHDCPLVALVPYASARWPAALQRSMTIIQWDRPTGVSLIHARVGKGHDT
jgi:hypothetical protein